MKVEARPSPRAPRVMRKGSIRKKHTKGCPAALERARRCRCGAGWQIRYRDHTGVRHHEGGFATKVEAERALNERLRALDTGSFRRSQPIAFDEFTRRWIETYARPTVKPATLRDYEGTIRNHLVPYFGDVALSRITREMIQRFMADKAAHKKNNGGPTWSAKTINNMLVPLREMLGHAVEWGYLSVNPAVGVRPLPREAPEREILTPEELNLVLDKADEQMALVIRLAAFAGLRRGEILGLRWGDLELEQQRLHVRQTYGNHGFGSPKSKAGRRLVPLTPGLAGALRRHKLAQPPNEFDLAVATTTGRPINPRNLATAWYRVLRKAGLRQLPFHSLRHTAVSLLIAHEGLNPKQLSAVIGHASIQLTYDTYGHLMPDAFDGFGEMLDKLTIAEHGSPQARAQSEGAVHSGDQA